ncbi:Hsp20/alpha crystallin family protein [Treponema sp.]|uniref:Hsp20/alpha crystallin family protein n=1 Tax=Treponema sp. TaxID=166 RepID=UPI003F01D9E2
MNELSLLDSLFGNDGFMLPGYRETVCAPKVDVVQKKDSYILYMDLPGKTEKDVDITLKNDVLTVASVENTNDSDEKKEKTDSEYYILRERTARRSQFKRSFTLPKDIDADKVNATFKNGILSIEIGRKEDAAERKIAIKSA